MPLPEQRIKNLLDQLNWNRLECVIDPNPLGSTNESYLCTVRGEKYVLRLGTKQAGILSINRHAEEAALKLVSKLQCGANLIYYDLETGNMVTEYIRGREMTGEDLQNPPYFCRMIQVLKTVHAQKMSDQFDFYADIERRLNYIKEHNIPLHAQFNLAYEKYQQYKNRNNINPVLHYGLCHGDPFPNNFILSDSGKVFLIDYEFAGMSDIFFDLACIAPSLALENQKELLRLYFGKYSPSLLEKLYDFFVINLMWNGTWAYVKSMDVPAEVFDFVKFGDTHIDHILNAKRPEL